MWHPLVELFFNTNAKAAILVGQAQSGVAILACVEGRTGNRRRYSAADQTGAA